MLLSLKPNLPEASKPGPRREVAPPSDGCVFPESLAWVQVGDRTPLLLPPGQGQGPQSDPWERVRAGLAGRDQAEKPPAQVVAAPLMLQTQGPVNLHLCTCGHGASGHSDGGSLMSPGASQREEEEEGLPLCGLSVCSFCTSPWSSLPCGTGCIFTVGQCGLGEQGPQGHFCPCPWKQDHKPCPGCTAEQHCKWHPKFGVQALNLLLPRNGDTKNSWTGADSQGC